MRSLTSSTRKRPKKASGGRKPPDSAHSKNQGAYAPRSPLQATRATRTQVAGTGLEEAATPGIGLRCLELRQGLQAGEVRMAVRAADGGQVKPDIVLQPLVQHLE